MSHHTPRPGETGKGRGKGKQSVDPRLEPGMLQDGGDRRPPTPPAVAEGVLPAAARDRGSLAGPSQERSPSQLPAFLL